MNLFTRIEDFPKNKKPIYLTLGTFDGLHLGHQSLLNHLRQFKDGFSCALTFNNHPTEILNPNFSSSLIATNDHKIKLFQQFGINHLISIPFTQELSEKTADHFLSFLQTHIPFSHLILGYDAKLGKHKHGDKEHILRLAKEMNFNLHYLEPSKYENDPISSTLIRKSIQSGDFALTKSLLGRPYSIYSNVQPGEGKGKQIGFPTINVNVNGLCLPPLGVYTVTLMQENTLFKGIANLGVSPTIKNTVQPTLEVHLFDVPKNIFGLVEVFFHQFLRPEKKFESIEKLKLQITEDIKIGKLI